MSPTEYDREFRTGFCLGLASQGAAPAEVEAYLQKRAGLLDALTSGAGDASYIMAAAPIVGGLGAGYFGGRALGDVAFSALQDKDAGKKQVADYKNKQVSDELRFRIAQLKGRQPQNAQATNG